MKYLPIAGALIVLCSGSAAYAEKSAKVYAKTTVKSAETLGYVSLSGDLTWLLDSDVRSGRASSLGYDLGGGGNLAVGFKPLERFVPVAGARTELELGYHFAGAKNGNGSLRYGTLMANAYYDMPTNTQFTPYIGAGLGVAEVYLPRSAGLGNIHDSSDRVFAYQAMAGVAYALPKTPEAEVYLGYRYTGLHKPQFDHVKLHSLNTHSVEVGLRYHF